MGRAQLEELRKHGFYFSTPKGVSMNPMLYESDSIAKIETLTKPPVRYDVVMYIRGKDQGVIHRVLRKKEDTYIINGDNCWQKERVRQDQIYGVVTSFYRKGRWHEVTEPAYRLYAHIWTDLFWIRRPLLYLRDHLYVFTKIIRKAIHETKK